MTVQRDPDRGAWLHPVQVSASERRAAATAIDRARRRRLTDDLLEKVAVTYRAAGVPKHETVARAFDVSARAAQRYIAAAREKGFIDASSGQRQQLPPQVKKTTVTDRTTGKPVLRYQVTVDAGVKPETGRRKQTRMRFTTDKDARDYLSTTQPHPRP